MKSQIVNAIEAITQDVSHILRNVTAEASLSEVSAKVIVDSNVNPVVKVVFADYVNYTQSVRRISCNDIPSLDNVRDWALGKGIGTDNTTLWAISDAMQNVGQSVYPLLSVLENRIEEYFDNSSADRLFELLTQEIGSLFTK